MMLLEVCEYNDLFIIIVVVQGGDVLLDYFILRAVSIYICVGWIMNIMQLNKTPPLTK